MSRKKKIWAWVLGAVTTLVVVPGLVFCWFFVPEFNPYSPVYSDLGEEFDDAVGEFLPAADGVEVPLRGFVPFEWDTVSIFTENAHKAKYVNLEVGVAVMRGDFMPPGRGALMVFCEGGHIVDVHYYPYLDLLPSTPSLTYSDDVFIGANGIREPSAVEVEANCS